MDSGKQIIEMLTVVKDLVLEIKETLEQLKGEGKETKRKQIKGESGHGIVSRSDVVESSSSEEDFYDFSGIQEKEDENEEKEAIRVNTEEDEEKHTTYEFLCLKKEILENFLHYLSEKRNIIFEVRGNGIENDSIKGKYTVTIRFATPFSMWCLREMFLDNYSDIEINYPPRLKGKCSCKANVASSESSSIFTSISQRPSDPNGVLLRALNKYMRNWIKKALKKKKQPGRILCMKI